MKKIVVVFVGCALFAFVAQAQAQGLFGGKTFSQRLDDFGRTVFGPGNSAGKESPEKPSTQATPKNSDSGDDSSTPRAGSISESPHAAKENRGMKENPDIESFSPRPTATPRAERYDPAAPPISRATTVPPSAKVPPHHPLLGSSNLQNEELPNTVVAQPEKSNIAPRNPTPQTAQISEFGPPPSQPIQNRLLQSRTSAFNPPNPTEPRNASPTGVPAGTNFQPTSQSKQDLSNSARYPTSPQPPISNPPAARIADQPMPAVRPPAFGQPTPANQPKQAGQPTPAKRPGVADQPDRPLIVQRPPLTNAYPEGDAADMKNPLIDTSANPSRTVNPVASVKEDALLFMRRGPVLSVETLGPRKIIIGKESTYEVVLSNSGEVGADELVVFVSLPEWAEVAGAEASSGVPQFTSPGQIDAPFQWKVGHLEAKAREKLTLRIIPRQSKPFDLAVRWDYKPVASQAMIEVQEPKLEMQLEGPREVFYGKKETFRLKMLNNGTGSAEGVVVKLMPTGSGENVPATYPLRILPAGESKNIEFELTARQAGDLNIRVEAKGDAGIHAELDEKVLVRRAGLEVGVEGPQLQYVGTTGTYTIRVRNPGNAPAKNIRFATNLPAGMKYVGGIAGLRADASGMKLQWILDNLNPQLETIYSLKCQLGTGGTARLDIAASAEDDLSALAGVSTQVEVVANISLDVQEPVGPVSLGEEPIYEVRIRNRGTKEAEGVEVMSYFSRGIEPIAAEGGPNRIATGQVAFAPLPILAPGADVIYKIRAKAETAGNHVFRAEVHCKAMGTRLICERNTLYYQDNLVRETPDTKNSLEANRNPTPPENYRTQRR